MVDTDTITCERRGCTKAAAFAFIGDNVPEADASDADTHAHYCADHAAEYAAENPGTLIRGMGDAEPAVVPKAHRGGVYRGPDGDWVELDPDEEATVDNPTGTWHRDPRTGVAVIGPHPEGV